MLVYLTLYEVWILIGICRCQFANFIKKMGSPYLPEGCFQGSLYPQPPQLSPRPGLLILHKIIFLLISLRHQDIFIFIFNLPPSSTEDQDIYLYLFL